MSEDADILAKIKKSLKKTIIMAFISICVTLIFFFLIGLGTDTNNDYQDSLNCSSIDNREDADYKCGGFLQNRYYMHSGATEIYFVDDELTIIGIVIYSITIFSSIFTLYTCGRVISVFQTIL